jgi:hypothetical protein
MRKSNLCNNCMSCNIYVKVDFIIEQAMKTQKGGVGVQLYSFFNLDIRSGWVVSTIPQPLYPPGKETRYPLYRRLGGPQGRFGRVRKISLPTGIRSSDRPSCSESLYRLNYPGPPKIDVHKPISSRLCSILTKSALIFFQRPTG